MAVALTGVSATGQINSLAAPGVAALTLPVPKLTVSGTGAVPDVLMALPALKFAAQGTAGVWGGVTLVLPVPTVAITGPSTAKLAVPVPKLAAAGTAGLVGSAALTLPAPRLQAGPPNGAQLVLPTPALVTAGQTGVAGTVTLRLPMPAWVSVGEVPFTAGAALTCPVPQLAVSGVVGQVAAVNVTLRALALAIEGATGTVGEVALLVPFVEFGASGYQAVTGAVQLTLPHLQLVMTGERAALTPPAGASNAIAMHTEAMALSTYSNFPFNSFALFNGLALGACDSGIFSLGGNTDNGALIQAAARVGISDFGTSFLKRVDRVYVGYRTDGNLVLRVFTDEVNVRDYLLSATGKSGLHGNHARLGKGLVARYWQFELRNQDGADFEMNMIELKPTKLRRRVGGGDA